LEHFSFQRVANILLLGCFAALLSFVVPVQFLPGITRTIVFAGAAMTLNLLIGNTGLLSLCQGLFMGLGAYAVALGNTRFGIPVFPALAIGLVLSVPFGALIAAIALRARHLFFGLLTLAICQVGYVLLTTNYDWTGGDDGVVGIELPSWLQSDVAQNLFVAAGVTIIVLFILFVLSTPFGVVMRGVRDNPERVASLGANPKAIEFTAMMLSGFLATICGGMLAISDQSVSPVTASWVLSANLLVMVALGGRSFFFGPILGVVILETVRNFVQGYSEHSDLVVGMIIICCALVFPEGITSKVSEYVREFGKSSKRTDAKRTYVRRTP
jgi:branched-chain amino acid transport system permease protein